MAASNGPRGVPQSLPVAVGVPVGQHGPSLSSPKGWPLACPHLQPWAGSFIPEFGGVFIVYCVKCRRSPPSAICKQGTLRFITVPGFSLKTRAERLGFDPSETHLKFINSLQDFSQSYEVAENFSVY